MDTAAAEVALTVADMEKGAKARVGVALVLAAEEMEVPGECGCAMMRICPPCPFGLG